MTIKFGKRIKIDESNFKALKTLAIRWRLSWTYRNLGGLLMMQEAKAETGKKWRSL